MICKICNKEVFERKHWWVNHKVKEKTYYETYLPKFDLYTTEKIEFIEPEQYELTFFSNKKNLKSFLEKNTNENGIDFLINCFKLRKQIKNIIYAPSEFELRALQLPSVKYIENHYGNGIYNKICEESSLKIRFDYHKNIQFQSNKEIELLVDSREQKMFSLNNYQIKKLPYADYTIENNNGIYVERKSIIDIISTVTYGFDRFCREIERCKNDNNYIVVLIEEKFNNLLSFPYLPHCKRTKVTVSYFHHKIRELSNMYPLNIQFLAVDGRKECSKILQTIFQNINIISIRNIDLQYEYDQHRFS